MGISDFNPLSKDFDPKRAALAFGTGGMTEAGGAIPAYETATGSDIGGLGTGAVGAAIRPVTDIAKALGAGVEGMFTGPTAVAATPTQNTSSFGDPGFTRGRADTAAGIAANREAQMAAAQGRTVDTSQADAARADLAARAQALQDFAQREPGPSAAEAQLRLAQDQNQRQALAMARSSRGNLGANAALNQAAMQSAQIQGQTAGQLALVRAEEENMFRNRQLEAEKAAADVTATLRSGDLETISAMLQNRQVNDAFSVALGQQGLSAEQIVQAYAQMDGEQRLMFEQMVGDWFMTAQQTNIETDAQRDAALIAALGGLGEAGLGFAGQVARAGGDAVPL